jgi:hypothetical protein
MKTTNEETQVEKSGETKTITHGNFNSGDD